MCILHSRMTTNHTTSLIYTDYTGSDVMLKAYIWVWFRSNSLQSTEYISQIIHHTNVLTHP